MTKHVCECSDPGCPIHGRETCLGRISTVVLRIDMEDVTGTLMCRHCANDALESGVFRTGDVGEYIRAKKAR